MGRFVLFYIAIVLLVDAVLLAFFVAWYYLFIAFVSAALIFLIRWISPKQFNTRDIKGLVLGKGIDVENPDQPVQLNVVLEEKSLDLGFLGIGGPGSGKSICGIVMLSYYTLQRQIGWCAWDGKGDKDIYQKLVAVGAKPDKFFSSDLIHSDTTNVVAGPTPVILEALTQTLIISESEYYKNAQREALGMIIPLLKSCGKPIVLRDIYVALKVEEAGLYVMKLAKDAGAAPDVIALARQFFDKDSSERENDINGLMTKMSQFVTGDIAARLNAYEPTLDLFESAKKGERVFLHLPYSTMSRDISILFTEQIGVIAKNRQLYDDDRKTWPQIFDDWGKFFYPNVAPITARCRSAKMPVSYLFQSKGQTDAVDNSRIFTTEIMDNIGGFFVFRINGYDTAKWAAEQFGTFDTVELGATDNSSYSGQNVSTREAPRVRADVLKDLNAGECYVSCLVSGKDGESSNKRYRVRFPYPKFIDEKSVTWPHIEEKKSNESCDGLHLWRDFMDRDRLQALKKEVVQAARDKEKQETSDIMIPLPIKKSALPI